MLWAQLIPVFLLWLGFIWVMRSRVQETRRRLEGRSRTWRVTMTLVFTVGSLAFLFGGLWFVLSQRTLAADGQLTIVGTIGVAVVGIAFLYLEMIALTLTLSLATDASLSGVRDVKNTGDSTL